MTLLRLPFLLPSVLIFNASYIPPNPAPRGDEVVSGPLYEQICPVVYPVLQRVSNFLIFVYLGEHLVTVIRLNTLYCGDSDHTRSSFSFSPFIRYIFYPSPRKASRPHAKPVLHTRDNPCQHWRPGAHVVFPRHGTPLHSPTYHPKKSRTHYRWPIRHRSPPRLCVQLDRLVRNVPHLCEPRIARAVIWMALDLPWAHGPRAMDCSSHPVHRAKPRPVYQRRCHAAQAFWRRMGSLVEKGAV